jgi:hypothetical protein
MHAAHGAVHARCDLRVGIELRTGICILGVCSFWMLYMFYLDVAYVAMAIHLCCKCILQMFQLLYLDVAYVAVAIHVCCKCMFQMFHLFQTMLQVLYLDVTYVLCR